MPTARPDVIVIATLERLWKAARSLARIRSANPAPSALWQAYPLRILDARPTPAFEHRHLPEATSLPADELPARTHELPPKERGLIVIADAPAEAEALAADLRTRGWTGAVALAQSIDDWPGPWESGPARRFLWEPAPLVARWAAHLPHGRLLDLGCGSGRDAVYLALLGHAVLAVDRLPDALARTRALAERLGVELECAEMDLRQMQPAGEFEGILMVRFLERALFPYVRTVLKPGGLFLLETFAQTEEIKPRWTLAPQEALRAFSTEAFTILEYREEPLVRLVARKEP